MINIKSIFSFLLTKTEKRRFVFLGAGTICNGLLQMISIVSVLPFLGVAANPNLIQQNQYLKMAYDTLNFSSSRDFLLFLGGTLIFLIFLVNLSNALFTWLSLRFTWWIHNSLSVRLMQHYLDQDYLYFTQRNSADLQKNIQTEVMEVTSNVINPILTILNKGISLLLTIILLIVIDPLIALFVGVILVSVYFCIFLIAKKGLSRIGRQSLEDNEAKFRAINEALGLFKIAKLSHLEPFFISRFMKASLRFSRNQSKRFAISQLPRFAVETVAFTIMIGICLIIIAVKPSFTEAIPVLGLYTFAAYRLMPGMQQSYTSFSVLRSCLPRVTYLNREFQSGFITSTANFKNPDPKPQAPAPDTMPIIEFQDVTFSYPNTKTTTIDNICFSITDNTTVGFFGETGSGKTTIIDLILGLLFPDAGAILIDGKPLNRESLKAWQKSIGYVPQDIYLTDNTIAENIAFGISKDNIDWEQVHKVSILANIADFIEGKLINKYETIVGERGIRLSGGERQRIGIARALYHQPRLLVFDEATSALDNETEKSVMEAIEKFSHQKSIIIIAHRLTTLQKCDRVYRVDNGRIVKSGTFDEVVQQAFSIKRY